jgi:hypothetical protein
MRKNQKAAAPVRASAANRNSNAKYITTVAPRRASTRAKLTPTQRGRFWQSAGDAIEVARAGRSL